VAVTHFEKHRYGGGDAPPSAADVQPVLPRKFFMIFDFAFMDPSAIIKARQTGLRFLDTVVQPGDAVTLISYSPTRNLVLHEYMAVDLKKVRQIVEAFGLRNVAGRAENLQDYYLAQMQADLADALAPQGRGDQGLSQSDPSLMEMLRARGTVIGESQKAGYAQQVLHFSQALKNLASTLRYISGTKYVLFFSSGIARQILYGKKLAAVSVQEWSTPEQLAANLAAYDDAQSDSSLRDVYTEMLDEFKTANCQVFSFNESKVRGEYGIEDSTMNSQGLRELSGEDSLRQFASETGGKYYNNTMDVAKALADVQSLTGAFYVLGYRVDEKWDGAYHKVKVKVSRKGAKVQAQAGYYNLKAFEKFTAFEKLLQLVDLALGETPQYGLPVEIPLSAVPVRSSGTGLYSGYALLPAETFNGILGKSAEAFVFVFDGQRNVISIKRFRLPAPPADRDGLLFDFSFLARPGAYESTMVIRNPQTGRGARGTVRFTVPDFVDASAWADPLLLLEEGRNTLAVSATGELSLARMFGYDAARLFPRSGEVPAGIAKLNAAVRFGGLGDGQDLTVAASALDPATQARTPLPAAVASKSVSSSSGTALLELGAGGLAPGRYDLSVVLQSKSAGASALATAILIVK